MEERMKLALMRNRLTDLVKHVARLEAELATAHAAIRLLTQRHDTSDSPALMRETLPSEINVSPI